MIICFLLFSDQIPADVVVRVIVRSGPAVVQHSGEHLTVDSIHLYSYEDLLVHLKRDSTGETSGEKATREQI